MNRRRFMQTMFGTAVSLVIQPTLITDPLELFFDMKQLHGIPYHEQMATVGTWMGITRSETPWKWKVEPPYGKLTWDTLKLDLESK